MAEVERLARAEGRWECAWIALGHSPAGTPVRALLCGAAEAEGAVPLAERPLVWVLGPLDGESLAGAEAVVVAARHLFALRDLRGDVALAFLPVPVPDAHVEALAGRPLVGRPGDEDGDGRVDEDGPDDLDGDGRVLEMVVEDPRGTWTWDRERRFLVPAAEGDAPRLLRVVEGRDDDRDGRFNEDGAGPAVLAGAFPVGWKGGALPLQDEVGRRLAEEIVARPTACVLVFQGNEGGLRTFAGRSPYGRQEACRIDERTLRRWASSLAQGAAAPGWRVREPNGGEGSSLGSSAAGGEDEAAGFLAWCELVAGVPAVEIAPWGPERGGVAPVPTAGAGRGPVGDLDERWARWLDDRRGGMGYVAWRPVALGEARAWVGGWEPWTRTTPPAEELANALEGIGGVAERGVRSVPRLEIELCESVREGDLVRLAARVRNVGGLPTALAARARPAGGLLALDLPVGAEVFAGRTSEPLPALAGGASSLRREWLVLAPEGSPLVLRCTLRGRSGATREVRP